MRRILLSSLLCLAPTLFANPVKVIVSVDWEGESLKSSNLAAFENFRDDYPEINIMHFLNAAYYTKPNADENLVQYKILRILRNGDEQGMHIHSWRSLVEAAGVTYRSTPSWEGRPDWAPYDCGHNVPMSAYTYEELRQIIHYSVSVLTERGDRKSTRLNSSH